ncbi:HDOD domain-containing protein [Hydrogenophaga sp. 5NK40-0174]|uniref:HDOD domain-containing protein n=1 Tax=Hydrogenophaga sp. 5NK40-0174 TaxID=3127649 RepID=UPI003104B2A3
MPRTVLDSVAMGYQPVWSRTRQLVAVRLVIRTLVRQDVDGEHLLRAMGNDWPKAAPSLILAPEDESLAHDLLSLPPLGNTWLELPAGWFQVPDRLAHVAVAVRRGHRVLRHASLQEVQGEVIPPVDVRSLLTISPHDALVALQSRPGGRSGGNVVPNPIVRGQLYEGVASQALAAHCLDESGAWGLLEWPNEDVLHNSKASKPGCDALVIEQLRQLLRRDTSIDRIERLVRQDPVMTYRLLLMANSAAFGLSQEIGSLKHALMMIGFDAFGRWLLQQQRGACQDMDMHPVRYAAVMRARLAQHLLDSSADRNLRAEVHLASTFTELDQFMHESLGAVLHRLPLSGRLLDAALRDSGPYSAYIGMAKAQTRVDQLGDIPKACDEYDFSLDHANRALLRMIATSRDHFAEKALAAA